MTRARLSLSVGRLGGTTSLALILALAFTCLLAPASFAGRKHGDKKPGANPAGATNPGGEGAGTVDADSSSDDEASDVGGVDSAAPPAHDGVQPQAAGAPPEGQKPVLTDAQMREIVAGINELWIKEKARLAAQEAAATAKARAEAEMQALAARAEAGDAQAARELFVRVNQHLADLRTRAMSGDREAQIEVQAIAAATQQMMAGRGQLPAAMQQMVAGGAQHHEAPLPPGWEVNNFLRRALPAGATNFRIVWTAGEQPQSELEFAVGLDQGRCHVHATVNGQEKCVQFEGAPGSAGPGAGNH